MSPEEIKQRLAKLADLKIHPRDQMVNRALIARAERLCEEMIGDARDLPQAMIWREHACATD